MIMNGIGQANYLKTIFYLEFGVDGTDVVAHSLLCKLQLVSNLVIVKSCCDEPENFLLTIGKGLEPFKSVGDLRNLWTGAVVHCVDQF